MTTTTNTTTTRRPRRSVGSAIVGVFGELLITAGLILGLYVVYQLWWTDVVGEQAQQTLSQEFEVTLPASPAEPGTVGEGEPPVLPEPPLDADTFARLWVPRWDGSDPYVKPVSEGTDRATVLDPLGIGHYEGTALPGQVGNFALAGHRQTHGKPFYHVDSLQQGDELIVETADAWYVYRVTTSEIVAPTEVRVIQPNPDDPAQPADRALITLTTCHPLYSTRERYIVHGELDHWIPRDAGRPEALVGA